MANHRIVDRPALALRLLLALALALTPLWSFADLSPADPVRGDGGTQMPCHSSPDAIAQAAHDTANDAACPHCVDAASTAQCQCCGHAAPAGIGGLPLAACGVGLRHAQHHRLSADALPDSPRESPYRPPISAS